MIICFLKFQGVKILPLSQKSKVELHLFDNHPYPTNPPRLEGLRNAGDLLTRVLDLLQSRCESGMSALELDSIAEEAILANGATPTFKGYRGYPNSLCWRQDGILVHGIPRSNYIASAGDLIGIDCGVTIGDWVSDACRLFVVPGAEPDRAVSQLHKAAVAGLNSGLETCVAGKRLGDIGYAIDQAVNSCFHRTSEHYGGHYIGKEMHEAPNVPNRGLPGTGPILKAGDVLCIEPVILQQNTGYYLADDGWTVVTSNGLGCQIEAMVEVQESGAPRVLAA